MESIFLAQLLGIYFMIAGVIVSMRRKSFIPVVAHLGVDRILVLLVALVELFAGIAIVLSVNVYLFDWEGLITFIGWWMIVESVLYLSLPTKSIRTMIRQFNRPEWYVSGGFLAVVLGAYLTGKGFGLF